MILSDHPFRLNNDSHKDAQNIPSWIIRWLKNKFINYKSVRDFPKKIFIERKNDLNGRVIENNLELHDLFKKKDFHFIILEDYDFKDQILDEYFLVDLKSSYKFYDNYKLNFSIKNLFDKNYENAFLYSGTPRTMNIGLKFAY